MASNLKLSTATVNDIADAVTPSFDNGYIRIYDGTQPASPATAVTSQVLLAELRFNATAFGAASSGAAVANAITADASANATGTATWFRLLASDGTTVIADGSVDTVGADMNLNTTSIIAGQVVELTSGTLTAPAS